MRYVVVIEKSWRNYSAYVPDLPGCIAAGRTRTEARRLIGEAIRLQINGLREDGSPVPAPTSACNYIEA